MQLPSIFALAFFVAVQVSAQDGRGPGRGRFPAPSVGFTALDVNGDGTLDAGEIELAPTSLARLDKNSDGRIDSDEVRSAMPQGRGRGGPGGGPGRGRGPEGEGAGSTNIADETVKTLMGFDSNGDGKLSSAELPERFQGLFERGDQNKDGFLTPEEIRRMAAAQAPPPEPAGRGGREGGRGGEFGGELNFIRMDAVLAAVDSDGDGVISSEELRKSATAIRKLDKDGDGNVTRQEATRQEATRDEATPPAGPGRAF